MLITCTKLHYTTHVYSPTTYNACQHLQRLNMYTHQGLETSLKKGTCNLHNEQIDNRSMLFHKAFTGGGIMAMISNGLIAMSICVVGSSEPCISEVKSWMPMKFCTFSLQSAMMKWGIHLAFEWYGHPMFSIVCVIKQLSQRMYPEDEGICWDDQSRTRQLFNLRPARQTTAVPTVTYTAIYLHGAWGRNCFDIV